MSISNDVFCRAPSDSVVDKKGITIASIGKTVVKVVQICISVLITSALLVCFAPSALIGFGVGFVLPREVADITSGVKYLWNESAVARVGLLIAGAVFFPITVGCYFANIGAKVGRL